MESGKTESLEMNFSSAAAVGGSEELTTECHQIRRISTEKSFKNPQNQQMYEVERLLQAVPKLNEIFDIVAKVGEGTFSSVFLANVKSSTPDQEKKKFVVKHIIPTSHPDRILTELICMQNIGGKDNVMGLNLCLREQSHVVMVMPYFPHDKFHHFIQNMTVEETREYMKNLFLALRRVHQFNIIHRDVKPSNFLYNRKERKYALVDFGLAQKVPTPKRKTRITAGKEDTPIKITVNPKESQLLKRKIAEINPSVRLTELNINTFQNKNTTSQKFPLAVPSSGEENRPKRPRILSPRKEDRTVGTTRTSLKTKPHGQNILRVKNCRCFGKAQVCEICTSRSNQVAPRAGTPGFRAPEVLIRYESQTTAVDMWAAGVIFLSILARRYPFFKVPDDLTGLAQIMSIHGSEEVKMAARKLGKDVQCNIKLPAMDLQQLCQKLQDNKSSSTTSLHTRLSGNTLPRKRSPKQQRSPQSQKSALSGIKVKRRQCEEFPKSAYDLLRQLLDLNPSTRITAEGALHHPFITGADRQ
ncbi:cell division cycle 7-related protein kinase-like [Apostichopus japonicus]|uniref:cell division cycle 7-related protein kinase-like n=1 Tax=Stichopus japonicus TaxID=307972 RepID=UPI003AB4448F